MRCDVVCLRPEADFLALDVVPPETLSIRYLSPDSPELHAAMAGARALVIPAVGPRLPAELFEGRDIELVQVTGAGVDRVDADVMMALGIAVANVPGGSSNAIAEYAVSVAISLLRRIVRADTELRAGNYREARSRMLAEHLDGLDGLTVGVVGLGVIGATVAAAFKKFGCEIVFHDPAVGNPDIARALDAKAQTLDALLEVSDVVTLHVPLLPATEGMISERELALMKAGAILINAARGGIVDEAALAASLRAGHLGGAAVDVYASEPPKPDNPLFLLGNDAAQRLLLTPHIAGVTRQSWAFLFRSAWHNVTRVLLHGEPPANRVL